MAIESYYEKYWYKQTKRAAASATATFEPFTLRLPAPSGRIGFHRDYWFGPDLEADEPIRNGWTAEIAFGISFLWFEFDFWAQYHIGGHAHESSQS